MDEVRGLIIGLGVGFSFAFLVGLVWVWKMPTDEGQQMLDSIERQEAADARRWEETKRKLAAITTGKDSEPS